MDSKVHFAVIWKGLHAKSCDKNCWFMNPLNHQYTTEPGKVTCKKCRKTIEFGKAGKI